LFGALYAPAKQLIESFSGGTDTGFKRVVMIQHPRPGVWIIGFLTGATHYDADTRLAGIYTPTAPTPNSGWVVLVPAADVHDVDLTVPAAMRTILSGGILTPPGVRRVESC
jgi:uncharacterized membrane protein